MICLCFMMSEDSANMAQTSRDDWSCMLRVSILDMLCAGSGVYKVALSHVYCLGWNGEQQGTCWYHSLCGNFKVVRLVVWCGFPG